MTMADDQDSLTDFDKCVIEAEESVIRGLVTDGAIEQAGPTALCEAELLAPWISTNEAGQKVLNVPASEQSHIGRNILEHSLRRACASLIKAAVEHGENGMQYKHEGAAEPSIPRLLDLAVHLGALRHIEPALVFTVMEDVMELSTIEEAEGVFGYLESRIQKMRQVYNFSGSTASGSKLSVLRICNQLLRRLSRASSSELCGRILMFLTRLLPLLDRSGLNVQGQFNTSHSTLVENVPEGALDSNGQPVDAQFYALFWGLQAVFQQPYSAMEPSKWATTIADIKRVLAEFAKQPVALASSSSGGAADVAEEAALTVKYLSSPKLMGLQLQDAALRRHFLLQALVFLHACQNPLLKPGTAAAQQAKKEALRSKQVLEAEALEGLLYAELQRTPKHGSQFSAAIRTILKRETQWTKWKSEGCQGYERKEVERLQPLAPSTVLQAAASTLSKSNRIETGSEALDRLWNITRDNVSCLKGDANRRKAPNLQEFLGPVITEMDPEEGIEEQYKTKKDEVYTWKALRQIARTSLPVFSKMLGATQPRGQRKISAKDDKKERESADARAKIDLEDAVHELFPDLVPEGARRKPAVATAASVPASAAVSEVMEAPTARAAADAAADPGAVTSADPSVTAAAAAAAAADAAPRSEAAAGPSGSGEAMETDAQPGPAAAVEADAAAEQAGEGAGEGATTALDIGLQGEADSERGAAGAAAETGAVTDGAAAAAKSGAEQPVDHATANGNGVVGPDVVPAEAVGQDADVNLAEAAAEGGEEDKGEDAGGRKGRSRAAAKRAHAEQPESEDAAADEADGQAEEPKRATRGSKRARAAAQ